MELQKLKDPSLYKVARPVKQEEFGESLDKLMSEMATLMYSSNGVGLSGPQVASDLRILVADMGYLEYKEYGSELVKMVNPVVIWRSDVMIKAQEQCLSYPKLEVVVERPDEITISYQTPFGEFKEQTYKNWQARVVLHEIDHFDGVTLFTRSSHMRRGRYMKSMTT